MKTERRHNLQTNELADKLAHLMAAVEPYSRTILGVLLALVAIVFAYGIVAMRDAERASQGWDKFFGALEANNPQDLEKAAEVYSTTRVAGWARLAAADLVLNGSINKLLSDKTEAQDELRRVAEMYHRVLTESEEKSPLVARAKYGLARTQEAQGELSRAREEYNEIVREGGPFAGAAKERALDLDRPETKAFYEWLASYQPPKPVEKPDQKIDFLKEPLPSGSGLNLPSVIGKDLPPMAQPSGAAPPATGGPATQAPAGESTPPAAPIAAPAAEIPPGEKSGEKSAPAAANSAAGESGPSLTPPASPESAPAGK